MKVLITGDTGFIGTNLKQHVGDLGHEVIGFSTRNGFDIMDRGQVESAVSGMDVVIHGAAFADPAASIDQPEKTIDINLLGTLNVLKACAINDVPCTNISSCEIYGDGEGPITEEAPFKPPNPYAMSKVFGERLVTSFVAQKKFSAVSLRFSGINFDPGFLSLPDRWVNPRAKMGTFWSYVDVRDAGLAIKLAVEADLRGHEVLNIAAHKSRYLEPTTELVRRYLPGTRIKPGVTGRWSGLDSSRAQSVLGFQARHVWENYLHRDGTPISN